MSAALEAGVARRIYGSQEIAAAVDRLAHAIAADHRGVPLLLIGVLKGALFLTVDLSRALADLPDGPSEIFVDFLSVSRYGMADSPQEVTLLLDAEAPIQGRNVVIVDDIADNGVTLEFLGRFVERAGPASLRSCVLFDKPSRRTVDVKLDYVGLPAPDCFVVGYGLDYHELYRNLPYLAELTPEAMRRL